MFCDSEISENFMKRRVLVWVTVLVSYFYRRNKTNDLAQNSSRDEDADSFYLSLDRNSYFTKNINIYIYIYIYFYS